MKQNLIIFFIVIFLSFALSHLKKNKIMITEKTINAGGKPNRFEMSETNKKKKYLLISIETRKNDYYIKAKEDMVKYARKHNYDFKYIENHEIFSKNISYYWYKPYIIPEEMPSYDAVMYLDSDIVVVNKSIRFESYFEKYPGKEFIYSSDLQLKPKGIKGIPDTYFLMNGGIFLIKVTNNTMKLMNDWKNIYINKSSKFWKYIDGKWECEGCPFSDDNFDQGEFITSFITNKTYPLRNILQEVPNYYFQNGFDDYNINNPHFGKMFTKHFDGELKSKIIDFLKTVNICAEGTFNVNSKNDGTVDCWFCNKNCKACVKNGNNCTKCHNGFLLIHNKCQKKKCKVISPKEIKKLQKEIKKL